MLSSVDRWRHQVVYWSCGAETILYQRRRYGVEPVVEGGVAAVTVTVPDRLRKSRRSTGPGSRALAFLTHEIAWAGRWIARQRDRGHRTASCRLSCHALYLQASRWFVEKQYRLQWFIRYLLADPPAALLGNKETGMYIVWKVEIYTLSSFLKNLSCLQLMVITLKSLSKAFGFGKFRAIVLKKFWICNRLAIQISLQNKLNQKLAQYFLKCIFWYQIRCDHSCDWGWKAFWKRLGFKRSLSFKPCPVWTDLRGICDQVFILTW